MGDDSLREEVQRIREALNTLSEKLNDLEAKVQESTAEPEIDAAVPKSEEIIPAQPAPPPVVPPPAPPADIPPPAPQIAQTSVPEPAPRTSGPSPAEPPAPPRKKALGSLLPGDNWETKIGRYWLNRIGIAALILGVAYFILYNFQNFAPFLKIATGFAVSGVLMFWGLRIEKSETFRWFGRGFLGGAWSLIYFTTYAMHHVVSVRFITSAVVDFALLALVAIGAVLHALRFRSQVVASLAFLLAFLTIFLSTVTAFTFVASILLVTGVVWISARMQWHAFCLYAVILSYFAFIPKMQGITDWVAFYSAGRLVMSPADFWLNLGFLALFWVGYSVALLLLAESSRASRNLMISAALLNVYFAVQLILVQTRMLYPALQALPLAILGAAHLLVSIIANRSNRPGLATTYLGIGLALVTAAIPTHFTAQWTSILWAVEIPLLVYLGIKFERRLHRLFAFLISLFLLGHFLISILLDPSISSIAGLTFHTRAPLGLFSMAALLLTSFFYWREKSGPRITTYETSSFHYYFALVGAIGALLIWAEIRFEYSALVLALMAVAILIFGQRISDRLIRLHATAIFAAAALTQLAVLLQESMQGPTVLAAYSVAAIFLALSIYYRLSRNQLSSREDSVVRTGYLLTFIVLLSSTLLDHLPERWVALAWTFEGAGLIFLGLRLREPLYRMSALAPLALAGILQFSLVISTSATKLDSFAGYSVAGVFMLLALSYHLWEDRWLESERITLRPLYTLVASLLIVFTLLQDVPREWVSFAWGLWGLLLVSLGFYLAHPLYRYIAAPMYLLAWFGQTFILAYNSATVGTTVAASGMVANLLGVAITYQIVKSRLDSTEEPLFRIAYPVAASALLGLLIYHALPSEWLVIGWALEGIALIGLGFALRGRIYRFLGLGVFGVLILKILIVDLAGAETIYRIIAFIVVGTILLLASFVYGRFSGTKDR